MSAVPAGLVEWLEHNERSTWRHVGDCETIVDLENRAKDRADELLDARRTHGGKTLNEFLAGE